MLEAWSPACRKLRSSGTFTKGSCGRKSDQGWAKKRPQELYHSTPALLFSKMSHCNHHIFFYLTRMCYFSTRPKARSVNSRNTAHYEEQWTFPQSLHQSKKTLAWRHLPPRLTPEIHFQSPHSGKSSFDFHNQTMTQLSTWKRARENNKQKLHLWFWAKSVYISYFSYYCDEILE